MQKVPNSTEKTVLKAAGLGERKIQFQITDSEAEVHSKIISDNGFPQLCNAGGYEFLHCQSNCRQIEILKCRWDAENLKSSVGSQSKIYIRPIQKNLNTEPIKPNGIPCERKEKCSSCSLEFCVSDLRQHVVYCIPPEFELPNIQEQETVQRNNQNTPIVIEQEVNVAEKKDSEEYNIQVHVEDTDLDVPQRNLSVDVNDDNLTQDLINPEKSVQSISEVVAACVSICTENNISDPVQILRTIQGQMVQGRKLDLETDGMVIEGDTNFILVDRDNLVKTAFEEIGAIENLRLTIEVQFYGEVIISILLINLH